MDLSIAVPPHQSHRTAIIVGCCMLGIAAFFSGTVLTMELANTLERRLDDSLKSAHSRGELKQGQTFEECELACAQAVIVELPTRNTPGIAKLTGFAMHDQTIYHWRNSP